ncbi:MAG: hypothetical protein MI702_07435 [Chlorobiales bacterium]|nr:hypothetical protein [Chlorobiales bacterium]
MWKFLRARSVAILISLLLILMLFLVLGIPNSINIPPFGWDLPPTSRPVTPEPTDPSSPTVITSTIGVASKESLGVLRVLGNSNQGIQLVTESTGYHLFEYRGGAYSGWPINAEPEGRDTWLTAVRVYSGDQPTWDGKVLTFDGLILRIADMGYQSSAEEAELLAQGQNGQVWLEEGDVITLIAVDDREAYSDNPGQILLEWFFLQY